MPGRTKPPSKRRQSSLDNTHPAPASSSNPTRSRTTSSTASHASHAHDNVSSGDESDTSPKLAQAFCSNTPTPYHMAVVTLIGSFASGMPLASMFKVYRYVMCQLYDPSIHHQGPFSPDGQTSWQHPSTFVNTSSNQSLWTSRPFVPTSSFILPPAPQLPNPPQCSSPCVQKSTSTYSAAMVTVGALLGLVSLSKASLLSRKFGRKPILLLTYLMMALALLVFRFAMVLPPYAAAIVVYLAVVLSEASASAPSRIAIQNYVVDTTSEAQRAGALSLIEGFGQIGAFPSSAAGGLLAAATGHFFVPFYADVAMLCVVCVYILFVVPETNTNRRPTMIDSWSSQSARAETAEANQGPCHDNDETETGPTTTNQPDHPDLGSGFTLSSYGQDQDFSKFQWRSKLRTINFLKPLSIFWPRKQDYSLATTDDLLEEVPASENQPQPRSQTLADIKRRTDFRLLNLAFVVFCEETYQVFLVPLLLLYNGDKFGFDVLQNGYLVSILQGCRALFLVAIFPPGIALARRYVTKMGLVRRKRKLHNVERQPLLHSADTNQTNYGGVVDNLETHSIFTKPSSELIKRIQRGKLDIGIMVVSYVVACLSFLMLASSSFVKQQVENGDQETTKGWWKTPWTPLLASVIGLQISSGSTAIRTALVVNAVSDQDQTKALAAHQMLCTTVAAFMPLVTSFVYGVALERGHPEMVWIFKALFAALSAMGALGLFWSHRGFYEKANEDKVTDQEVEEDEVA